VIEVCSALCAHASVLEQPLWPLLAWNVPGLHAVPTNIHTSF
jgi:hypothetical protein